MEGLQVKISVKVLPNDYTCDGEDRSPEIDIGGVNTEKTKCLAILVNDPDAGGGGGFVHWIAWNMELVKMIPEKIPKTPHVTFPIRAVQGTNSFGTIGYSGPCPPMGQTHHYFFKVYGLDAELPLKAGATKDLFVAAMQGHVVQYRRDVCHVREVAHGGLVPSFVMLNIFRYKMTCHEEAGTEAGA